MFGSVGTHAIVAQQLARGQPEQHVIVHKRSFLINEHILGKMLFALVRLLHIPQFHL